MAPSANPMPMARPTQAQVHRPAAVVNPRIWFFPVTRIVPTPRNPIPLITWAPSRAMSSLESKVCVIYSLVIMTKAEPRQTRTWVLTPAPRRLSPRSIPTAIPTIIARTSRRKIAREFQSDAASIRPRQKLIIVRLPFPWTSFPSGS